MLVRPLVLLAALSLGGGEPGRFIEPDVPEQDDYAQKVLGTLDEHCIECHSPPEAEGDLDLSKYKDRESALQTPEVWHRMREVLIEGAMPPETVRTRPTDGEIAALLGWIDAGIESGALPRPIHRPGHTTLRRLNRLEYRHAILDLFGVDYPTPDLLPADGVAHGFDVIGDVLSMPPVLFEKYFEAAEQIAYSALPPKGQEAFATQHFNAEDLELSDEKFYNERNKVVWMFENGSASAVAVADQSGEYLVRVMAGAKQAGPDPARLDIAIDLKRLARVDITNFAREPKVYELHIPLELGKHTISVSYINDYFNPDATDPEQRDRNLLVKWVELAGPVDEPIETPFQALYMGADNPEPREVIRTVARRAWRGEIDEAAVDALLEIADPEADVDERVRSALVAILASPRFLFRVEPKPRDEWREVTGYELATRLAAFLWSSVPSPELLELAATGELLKPAVVDAQVDLMLRDARASRLALAFADQWLQLRRLDDASPDPGLFPSFDDELRLAMKRESELFFDAILREDRRVSELVTADFTFVNERLAHHYGIAGIHGPAMRRIAIPAPLVDRRCGILGQGAVLTATSNPTRTSPVLRGKWILEVLFATPTPPPPPGVGALDESHEAITTRSIRERLEQHRSDPNCAVCHAPMDGLGLALEHFDAIGAWRAKDGDFVIDASVELPGDVHFDGPAGLRDRLVSDRALLRGLLRHLATFALGRGLVKFDQDALDAMLEQLPNDPTLRQVIHAVIGMDAFRRRYREVE